MQNNKNVLLLLTGRLVSQFGFVLYLTALPLHMLKLTNSLARVGVLLSVSSLPAVLITPFLGVWIERVNRKNFMIVCDFLSGLSYIVILLGFLTEAMHPIILAIIVAAINLIYSVFNIASTMMFSEVANENSLEKYNSIKSLIENGIAIYNPIRAAQNRGQAQAMQVCRAFAQAPCGGLKPRPGGERWADTACAREPDPVPLQNLCGQLPKCGLSTDSRWRESRALHLLQSQDGI